MKARIILSLVSISLVTPSLAFASNFSNEFIEFELPENWTCKQKKGLICSDSRKKKDALILIYAKKKGPKDVVEKTQKYMGQHHNFSTKQGHVQRAYKVELGKKFTGTDNINGIIWSKGVFLDSIVPGYYARYLTTIKQDLSITFVTLISKNRYAHYSTFFDKSIDSLKVFHNPRPVVQPVAAPPPMQTLPIDQPNQQEQSHVFAEGVKEKPKAVQQMSAIPALAFAALVGLFLWWRKKKRSES